MSGGSSGVRQRWLLLLAAVLIPFGIAYAAGSATKSSEPKTPGDSLASAVSARQARPSVVGLKPAVSPPALRAPTKPTASPQSSTSTSTSTVSAPPLVTTTAPPPLTTTTPPTRFDDH
jgi:hypothetical protein